MEHNAPILLVNFTDVEAQQINRAGFRADVGCTYRNTAGIWFSSPHPVHEYDVYVYNSESGLLLSDIPKNAINTTKKPEFYEELTDLGSLPRVRISFVGATPNDGRELIGTSHIGVAQAHNNVSIILPLSAGTSVIKPLHDLLHKNISQIKLPVRQYLTKRDLADQHPYSFVTAYINRNGNYIGAYSTSYKRSLPYYLALPQYQSNAAMLIKILQLYAELEPNLFPDYSATDWKDSHEFQTPKEIKIQGEIAAKRKETDLFVAAKSAELVDASNEFAFIKNILTALEKPEIPSAERLSSQVKKTLTYLGFKVTDIDEKITSAIRKEDLWVQDEDFIAIGEISGTQKKNPKRTEYNDLLGRMNTIFKRHDLVPKAQNITGLLILNYDSKTHPDRRPALYSGEDSDIAKAAADSEIGILSTVELYKLARAVLFGTLSKYEARSQIRSYGLINAKVTIPAKVFKADTSPLDVPDKT